jgi:membrane protease YdiL (CAAX protease family)
VLPTLAIALFLGPIEEFGWRGLALPLLQRRFTPFWAGLILGIIWAVWHIPAFLIGGTPQSAWSFAPYFAGIIAASVIIVWLNRRTMFQRSAGITDILMPERGDIV